MSKSLKKRSKNIRKKKAACKENLIKANTVKTHQKKCKPLSDDTNNTFQSTPANSIEKLEAKLECQKQKTREETKKRYNEARKNKRIRKAMEAQKDQMNEARKEAHKMREEHSWAQKQQQEENRVTEEEMCVLRECVLRECVRRLEESMKNLSQQRVILWKRCKRLEAVKEALKKRLHESCKSGASSFAMKKKGRYT